MIDRSRPLNKPRLWRTTRTTPASHLLFPVVGTLVPRAQAEIKSEIFG